MDLFQALLISVIQRCFNGALYFYNAQHVPITNIAIPILLGEKGAGATL